jgi:O-antigen/teichoic acid export membrane protein
MFKNILHSCANLKEQAIHFGQYIFEQNKSVEFIKNVKITFFIRALMVVCNATAVVVTARALGPAGRGEFSVAMTLSAIGVYISLMGLNAANTHFVAQRKSLIHHYIANNLFFSVGAGLLTVSGIIAARFFFPAWILIENKALFFLALLWIPFNLLNILSQSLLLGIGSVRKFNVIEFIAPVIALLGIVTLFLFNIISVEFFFFFVLVGQAASAFWALYYLKPFTQDFFSSVSLKLLKESLWYSVRILYFPSIFFYLLSSVDLLMLKYFLGEEQAGYYSVATAMASLLLLLPGSIGTLLFARLSQIPQTHLRKVYTIKVVKWLAALMLIILSVAFFLVKFLVLYIFGDVYQPAIQVFIGLMPSIFFASVAIVCLNYFSAAGLGWINFYSTAAALVVNIFLNCSLIPLLGIIGAAYAASFSQALLLMILIGYILMKRFVQGRV